ncbi:MAG: hypothetical protein EOM25_10655 [Deltaproteobacteria bacterium]|nr:hypothetical protein [Deltaproteobacteria bacterium]
MRKIIEFKIGDQAFTARELSVAQIRELLDAMANAYQPHLIDMLFPESGISGGIVAASLGLSLDDLDALDLAPSELETVVAKVGEANPFLSGLILRLADLGRKMSSLETSTGPSAA